MLNYARAIEEIVTNAISKNLNRNQLPNIVCDMPTEWYYVTYIGSVFVNKYGFIS